MAGNGRYVDAGVVHTYYEVEGQGEPLVLLHGGMVTIDTWSEQRGALAERFRIYLPERRGHGRTPDVPGPVSYELMAADTIAFMETVGIPAAYLVGWSDGGVVALEVALARPDLIRRLVLIGTIAHVEGQTPEGREWSQNLTFETLPAFLSEPYERLSPDGPGHLRTVFDKTVEMWRTEPRHEMSELASVTAPTLILMGDDDVLTVEHAAQMKRALPNAQLAVVPAADHGVMFDKPELVNRLLLDFLAEATSTRE